MTERLELTGESRRRIEFVNSGDNTCEIHIEGPFSSSAEITLDGAAMRALQNWLSSGLAIPDQFLGDTGGEGE